MVRQMIVFIILAHLVCVLLTESTHLYLMHNWSIEDTGPFIAPSPHVISNTYTPSHHNTSHENISQTRLPRPTIEDELDHDAPPIISADYIYGNFFDPPSVEMEVHMGSGNVDMSVKTSGEYQSQLLQFLA